MIGTFASKDHTYTVVIGTAPGTLTMAADPVHISWKSGDHIYVPVRSVSASIRILTDTPLTQLYASGPLDIPVTISNETECIFDGYIIPQEWQSPCDGCLDEIEIVAVDKLTALKNVRYVLSNPEDRPRYRWIPSLVTRAASIAGITNIDIARDFDDMQYEVDEFAFVADDLAASIYSDERNTWFDILEGLGTFFRHTFMMVGDTLHVFSIDEFLNHEYPKIIDAGEAGVGNTIEIKPAYSSIKVNYGSSDMYYNWEAFQRLNIDTDWYDPTYVVRPSYESTYRMTVSNYYKCRDWVGCGETLNDMPDAKVLVHTKNYEYISSEMITRWGLREDWCIAGPCHLRVKARRELSSQFFHKMTVEAYAGTMTTDGKKVCSVYSKDFDTSFAANNPIKLIYSDGSIDTTYNRYYEAGELKDSWHAAPGFQTATFELWNGKKGEIDIFIPEGWFVKSIKIEPSSPYEVSKPPYDEKNVVVLSDSFADQLEIDSLFKNMNVGLYGIAMSPYEDKYPYINTEQFSVPRMVLNTTIHTSTFEGFIKPYSTPLIQNVCIADAADIDLREEKVTISLHETSYQLPHD